ncbi:hypothetical protein ACJRO7_003853, partial [Eucalyptus globulus]
PVETESSPTYPGINCTRDFGSWAVSEFRLGLGSNSRPGPNSMFISSPNPDADLGSPVAQPWLLRGAYD